MRFQLTAILPYPPTTNNAYAVRNGRLVKTDKARAYSLDVMSHLLISHAWRHGRNKLTGSERFHVRISVFPPDRRRRDLSNIEKLMIDSVFKFLGADDSRIDRLLIERKDVVRDGELVLTLTTITEGETT